MKMQITFDSYKIGTDNEQLMANSGFVKNAMCPVCTTRFVLVKGDAADVDLNAIACIARDLPCKMEVVYTA